MSMNISNTAGRLFEATRTDVRKAGKQAPPKQQEKVEEKSAIQSSSTLPSFKSAEDGLSDRAKELLDKLREDYGDYGFAVAGTESEFYSMRGVSDKEYTVIFTSDELERMAEDEEYKAEQMKQVEALIDMTREFESGEEYQEALDELANKGYILENLQVSMNSDGTMNIFAELSKLSEKQAERIEEKREEAAKERRTSEQEAIAEKFKAPVLPKPPKPVGVIRASSIEELMDVIKGLDEEKISALKTKPGERFDFSV